MILETKLVERTKEKINHEDERAKETMSAGMLQDFSEYRYSAGYRKGLADALLLLNETHEEIMKE